MMIMATILLLLRQCHEFQEISRVHVLFFEKAKSHRCQRMEAYLEMERKKERIGG